MKGSKTIIFIVIAVVAAFVVWYFFIRKKKQTDAVDSGSDITDVLSSVLPSSSSSSKQDDEFPIKVGSRGAYVKGIQKYLNRKYKAGLQEDGIFGPKTEAALKKHGYPTTIWRKDLAKLGYSVSVPGHDKLKKRETGWT